MRLRNELDNILVNLMRERDVAANEALIAVREGRTSGWRYWQGKESGLTISIRAIRSSLEREEVAA